MSWAGDAVETTKRGSRVWTMHLVSEPTQRHIDTFNGRFPPPDRVRLGHTQLRLPADKYSTGNQDLTKTHLVLLVLLVLLPSGYAYDYRICPSELRIGTFPQYHLLLAVYDYTALVLLLEIPLRAPVAGEHRLRVSLSVSFF